MYKNSDKQDEQTAEATDDTLINNVRVCKVQTKATSVEQRATQDVTSSHLVPSYKGLHFQRKQRTDMCYGDNSNVSEDKNAFSASKAGGP